MSTQLDINGDRYSGFKSLSYRRSIYELAGTLGFAVAETWYQSPAQDIAAGHAFALSHQGASVAAGWLDGREVDYDSRSHEVSWIGRNAGGDLADCTAVHASGEFKNQAVGSVIGSLVEPFIQQLSFGVGANSTKPVNFAIEPGETRADALFRLLARQGWAAKVTANNALQIYVKPKRAAGALVLGENVKSGSFVHNLANRFYRYRVASQVDSGAWQNASIPSVGRPDVELLDKAIRKPREFVIFQDAATEAECRKRCEYERASRRGQSEQIQYTVAGWLQQEPLPGVTPKLWAEGELVPVYDAYSRIDAELLITEADLRFDDQQGHHCLLTVTHPDALAAEPSDNSEPLSGMGWDCRFDANGQSACEHPSEGAAA